MVPACRSAARQLGGGGLLSALLDDAPLPLAAPGTSGAGLQPAAVEAAPGRGGESGTVAAGAQLIPVAKPLQPVSACHSSGCRPDAAADGHRVNGSLASAFVDVLVGACEAEEAAAEDAAPARKMLGTAARSLVSRLREEKQPPPAALRSATGSQHYARPHFPAAAGVASAPAAAIAVGSQASLAVGIAECVGVTLCPAAAAATAEPDPALSSQPLAQLSTAELEVALHKAAAELRAAEVTAAAAEAAGDHEMPDFEAEDAAEDAAAAAATAAEGYSTEDGVSHVAKFAVAELEGEQGLEELLQEMQEEEQHWHQEELGQNQAQQQVNAAPPLTPMPAPAAAPSGPTPVAAALPTAPVPAASVTVAPQSHHRLSMYTFSGRWALYASDRSCIARLCRHRAYLVSPVTACVQLSRLELYVEQATWERLGRWDGCVIGVGMHE